MLAIVVLLKNIFTGFGGRKKCKSIVHQYFRKHKHDIKYLNVQPLETVKNICAIQMTIKKNSLGLKYYKQHILFGINDSITGQRNISRTPRRRLRGPHNFPIFSYSYTSPIAPKIVDYRRVLRVYNIDDLKAQPLACSCHKLFSI